ncbi:MAG: hypothetical protein FRX49_08951 [Trebouxia sp. A1-2]|nr:MAG: hypothetical protein FRX49_08951 [Trebouxia sp. A1-2]
MKLWFRMTNSGCSSEEEDSQFTNFAVGSLFFCLFSYNQEEDQTEAHASRQKKRDNQRVTDKRRRRPAHDDGLIHALMYKSARKKRKAPHRLDQD